jgi:hypothetical protein
VSAVRELADATAKSYGGSSRIPDPQVETALQQENRSLVNQVAQLQDQLRFKGTIQRIAERTYIDGDDDEICSRCAEVDFRAVHLLDMNIDGRGRRATCPQCKTARGDMAPPIPRARSEEIAQRASKTR